MRPCRSKNVAMGVPGLSAPEIAMSPPPYGESTLMRVACAVNAANAVSPWVAPTVSALVLEVISRPVLDVAE